MSNFKHYENDRAAYPVFVSDSYSSQNHGIPRINCLPVPKNPEKATGPVVPCAFS